MRPLNSSKSCCLRSGPKPSNTASTADLGASASPPMPSLPAPSRPTTPGAPPGTSQGALHAGAGACAGLGAWADALGATTLCGDNGGGPNCERKASPANPPETAEAALPAEAMLSREATPAAARPAGTNELPADGELGMLNSGQSKLWSCTPARAILSNACTPSRGLSRSFLHASKASKMALCRVSASTSSNSPRNWADKCPPAVEGDQCCCDGSVGDTSGGSKDGAMAGACHQDRSVSSPNLKASVSQQTQCCEVLMRKL
eukprot:CAMPEP_0177344178 /NCGR_PEP_ID=MMETSP0368-20130122/27973_1 /TAXON_ID=447022 ORGANISM="Scrippsiella hangoei-like, Strain SHHI-4" /NCGR_SAMPLE_ID=MMETSP0368 /ASSEMBLY_ACC=CAM_ASM_000363 /LENGTH=260 /DNA_ID=CAMNT_0018805665 /DNA_START=78 /DNA_END=856 /DNA_ORIENTATION=-